MRILRPSLVGLIIVTSILIPPMAMSIRPASNLVPLSSAPTPITDPLTQWVPSGPASDSINVTIYADATHEFTAMCGSGYPTACTASFIPQIDLTDIPVLPTDLPLWAGDANVFLTGTSASACSNGQFVYYKGSQGGTTGAWTGVDGPGIVHSRVWGYPGFGGTGGTLVITIAYSDVSTGMCGISLLNALFYNGTPVPGGPVTNGGNYFHNISGAALGGGGGRILST